MRLRAAALALLVAGSLGSLQGGCTTPNVALVLDLPADAQSAAAWIEIGAFPNGCPDPGQLAAGLPPSGLTARVAYAATDAPVALGDLPAARYGFAAIARGADCGVLADGCATVDVTSARGVHVTLDDATAGQTKATACASGLVCSGARCVPDTSGNDPTAGAGCSMVLVGAGPLPDPLDGGPYVTAPAIAPMPGGGFLVTYAEYVDDGTAGTYRVTLQPIDDGGGALAPTQQLVDGHCAGETSVDAAGLVMGASAGLAVFSRPPCNGKSGYDLLTLDASGSPTKSAPYDDPATPTIVLSTHAVAASVASTKALIAADVGGNAKLLATNGTTVGAQTTTGFGTPQDVAARVARTTQVVAVEADGPAVGEGGPSGAVARVYLAPGSSDPTSVGAPVDQVPASVSALTALGGRAFLLTDGAGKGETVSMRAYDLGAATQPVVTSGFTAAKTTPVLALDAAAAQNRLFGALEQQDSIAIAVFDGATSTAPQILQRVDLASDIRIPKSAHDGPIAIAASDTRVAITWVAHKTALTDGEGIGGYAVFACRP
jgi:hypothetical protein